MLTVQEKIEIMEISRNRSGRETALEFNLRHPNRPIPLNFRTVYKIQKHFQTHGTVQRKKRTSSVLNQNIAFDLKREIVEHFDEHPHDSTRQVGRIFGISHMTVWKALKESKLWPYKMSVHQKLLAGDQEKRKEFCENLLNIFQRDPNFYKQILWTDEKPFRISDTFNRQNKR